MAIAAGWIQAGDGGSTVTVSEPLAAPVDSQEEGGGANVVNEIYRHDGQGVAFISSQLKSGENLRPSPPSGNPKKKGAASRPARAF